MYYGGDTTVTCYGDSGNKTTTCPTNRLDDASKTLIDNHTWNTGAINWDDVYDSTAKSYDTVEFYKEERGSVNGKICSSGNNCNDTVERTTTWTGYVGLPYITDYAYASSESDCNTKIDKSSTYKCKNNNWMYRGDNTWYLSPRAYSVIARDVWAVYVGGDVGSYGAAFHLSVFPTIYLKSNILIESGTGTNTDPYILKLDA